MGIEYLEVFSELHMYIGYITSDKIYVKSVLEFTKDDLRNLDLKLIEFK